MTAIFTVLLEGQLDQARLDRFRKLLNLTPRGRLTDDEDAQFGHRSLRDTQDEWVWLGLWRDDDTHWDVRLSFAGPPLGEEVVRRCLAEVLGAASALGLAVTRVWPEPAPAPVPLSLPTRRALSVRLGGGDRLAGQLDIPVLDTLQRALGLYRERGAGEFGWRYVHWDPPRSSALLQVYDGAGSTEVALLVDGEPPAREVLAGLHEQILAAAARAGLRVVS